jgi:hypothetical protein
LTRRDAERWTLVFEPLPDAVPVASRIRTLLKIAPRCTHVTVGP